MEAPERSNLYNGPWDLDVPLLDVCYASDAQWATNPVMNLMK